MLPTQSATLKTWRVFELVPTPGEMIFEAIRKKRYRIVHLADHLMTRMELIKEPTLLELVRVTNADLDEPHGCYMRRTYQAADQAGLEVVPKSTAPLFRPVYSDQDFGEWLIVASRPFPNPGDGSGMSLFVLGHVETRRGIYTDSGHPDFYRPGGATFLFQRKRQDR